MKQIVLQLTDDLDGKPIKDGDGETVTFALDSQDFEIDLSAKNAAALRDALAKYVGAARRVTRGGSAGRRGRGTVGREYDPKAVRKWAESNNVEVPARGRIPAAVVAQFREAGN